MQPQQQQKQHMSLGEQINLAVGICQVFSFPVLAFLRRPGTWGSRFANHQAIIGTLFMPLFIAYADHSDQFAFPAFRATVVMFIVHRIAGFWRRRGTDSRYSGVPWLLSGNERRAKGLVEPVLVFLFSVVASPYSFGLSRYLMLSAMGLMVNHAYQWAWVEAEVRIMRDARSRATFIREVYEQEAGRD